MGDADGGAQLYAAWVEELALAQDARKTSFEQRGLAVITTSGTLVTVLFALVGLLTKSAGYKLPNSAHGPLAVALVAFVIASLGGLATNVPFFYREANLSDPDAAIWKYWAEPEAAASERITATKITLINSAKTVNNVKGIILLVAMLMEVTAVAGLAVAVGRIL